MSPSILNLEQYCLAGQDYSGDTFFLDTNALVSFVDPDHPQHLSTLIHTVFLLKKRAKLYISETVLSEAIDVLARGFYTEEQFQKWQQSTDHENWVMTLGRLPTQSDYRIKKESIRSRFIPEVVKNHANPELLRTYNQKATYALSGLLDSELFRLSNTSYSVIQQAMKFAKSVPLQANDAMIAAAACSKNAGLFTFDQDFKHTTILSKNGHKVAPLQIFSTQTTNNFYRSQGRAHHRMNELAPDLSHTIQQVVGGIQKFEEKFGPRAFPLRVHK